MSKQFENSFSWNVKRYEFNRKTIEDFDVIPFISVIIRKLKRQSVNKEEFAKKLSSEMKFRYLISYILNLLYFQWFFGFWGHTPHQFRTNFSQRTIFNLPHWCPVRTV